MFQPFSRQNLQYYPPDEYTKFKYSHCSHRVMVFHIFAVDAAYLFLHIHFIQPVGEIGDEIL